MEMAKKVSTDALLGDPLSSVTRRERRLLLGVSIFSIAMVKTGLVPSKISALGIEFANTDQRSILCIMALIGFYFLFAFLIYAASDFLSWRKVLRKERITTLKERYEEGQIGDPRYHDQQAYIYSHIGSGLIFYVLSKPLSIVRALFEFVLPVVLGIYAILLLFFHKIPGS
jgi:uncharacterized membrane protein